jgi:hypothetical protein
MTPPSQRSRMGVVAELVAVPGPEALPAAVVYRAKQDARRDVGNEPAAAALGSD